jgi:beta-lactamase regulating signal transducer with metallopeptidase domain
MNSFVETLNLFGGQFLNFAWPILWQSSLLIAFIFALDFLLARKIRASVRYALWLAVLVKLILPPTFASPTSATWWLWQTKTEIKTPAFKNYSVTYDNAPQTDFVPQTIPLPAPLPSKLNVTGCLLLASIFISAILFLLLAIRWWQIARKIRGAVESEKFSSALATARFLANSKSCARLKIVEAQMSPAVCGLFRPVILLPRALAEKLSAEQLRAVLLHELFHLRRKDVWVNCAQALLQIFYWWHPLLWFANARIRRVREEAVDDAVMLALRDEAETYVPTLLEVAKLALRRPLMSLGLVGIMESRSALRQRIERLLNFHAPKKAGVTFASLCGIFIFSAVALPMGEKPVASDNQIISAPSGKIFSATEIQEKNISAPKTNVPEILLVAYLYPTRESDFEKISASLEKIPSAEAQSLDWLVATNEIDQIQNQLTSIAGNEITMPRVVTLNGGSAHMSVTGPVLTLKTRTIFGINFSCVPNISSNKINLAISGQTITKKNNLMLTNLFYAQGLAENGGGFLIYAKDPNVSRKSNLVILINAKIITNFAQFQPRVEKNVQSISAQDFNQAKTLLRDGKLLYEMGKSDEAEIKLKSAIALEPENATAKYYLQLVSTQKLTSSAQTNFIADATANFHTRVFSVDKLVFSIGLEEKTGLKIKNAADVSEALKIFSATMGVNWESPEGKSVFYNNQQGTLFVKATEQDLNTLDEAIPKLEIGVRPQVHIKARFLEVPKGTLDTFSKTIDGTNKISGELTGILTPENFKTILRNLETRTNVEILAEPEGVTTSGRQMQMRATQIITVVTNFIFEENPTNHIGSITFQTGKIETGPTFDVVPNVLSDGYSLDLQMTASSMKFWGYPQIPTNAVSQTFTNSAGEIVSLPIIWPAAQLFRNSAHVILFDGQSAVLSLNHSEQVSFAAPDELREKAVADWIRAGQKKNHADDKEILVFITAEIVDSAGNRVHSGADLPPAQKGIPPADSSVNLHL